MVTLQHIEEVLADPALTKRIVIAAGQALNSLESEHENESVARYLLQGAFSEHKAATVTDEGKAAGDEQ